MKYFLIFAIFFASCSPEIIFIEKPYQEPDYSNDPRLKMISFSESSEFIAYPGGGMARKINDDPKVKEKCDKPKHSYIFFDDESVIEYAPPSGDVDGSVMLNAIKLTIEIHNRDNPDLLWDYMGVPPVITHPDTGNDPILGVWQVALVLDDGTIVRQWQAEFDWEWAMWKSSVIALELELYNRDNDPDAHTVWGPDL